MQKPVFGIDQTLDKENDEGNAKAFCVASISEECAKALEQEGDEAEQTLERARLSLPLRILQYVSGIAALLIAAGILRADVGFAQGYQNAAWLYWLCGACALVWLPLFVASRQKSKAVLESEEARDNERELEQALQQAYRELGVPVQAADVDLLAFYYTVKDGKVKLAQKALISYINVEMKIFVEGDRLCITDAHERYEFPLSEICGIQTVSKRICVPFWNKQEPHNKEPYKKFKITTNNAGMIFFKPYHILEIAHGGELWGIHFPCYELPVFEALTGHYAQAQPKR